MSLSSRLMSLGFLGVLFALTAVKHVFLPFNHDNAVHLKAARVILEHGSLYQNFFETNPPLFPYLTVLPVFLAQVTGGSEVFFYDGFVYTLAILVLGLAGRDLNTAGMLKTSADRILLLGSWVVILVGFQAMDFGQRDHLIGLLVLPYVVGLALRSQGPGRVSLRLYVAFMLAMAIAIKPQFLPVWILGEAWIMFRSKSIRAAVNSGNVLIVLTGLAYLLLTWWLEPMFYTEIVPLVRETYGAYGQPVSGAVIVFWIDLTILQGLVFRLQSRIGDPQTRAFRRDLVAALCLAAQGAFLGYLFQAHFTYHLWPFIMLSCATLPFALSSYKAQDTAAQGAARGVDVAFITSRLTPAVLVIILVIATPLWIWQGAFSRPSTEEGPAAPRWSETFVDLANLVSLIDRLAAGEAYAILSGQVHIGFPADHYTTARGSLRYHTLWPLPGLAGKTGEKYVQLKDKIGAQVAEDLAMQRPALILIDVSEEKEYFPRDDQGRTSFDYLEFFGQSEAFRAAFSHYVSCGTFAYQEHSLRIYIDKDQDPARRRWDICRSVRTEGS